MALFCTYSVKRGIQSSTIRSYISAIKGLLRDDNYEWNESLVMLGVLTRACKLENDVVLTKLPIHCKLLELMLFETDRYYGDSQPYLNILLKTILIIGYYGLFRIGELVNGDHTIKARDVHVASNKEKILIILYTSKTHGKESDPQQIKITSNMSDCKNKRFFCPFKLIKSYIAMRGSYTSDAEHFFILRDGAPIQQALIRNFIKKLMVRLGLNPKLYGAHCLRAGQAVDMWKYGYTVEQIKAAG